MTTGTRSVTNDTYLYPTYVTYVNPDFSGGPNEAFTAWKEQPCGSLSRHTLWGVFATNNDHLCLSVSKLERNGVVFIDYRLWDTTNVMFDGIFNEVGLAEDIEDMTYVEFYELCYDILYDISLRLNKT